VRTAGSAQVDIDVGLRDYMLRIYNYMASALALTGIVAYLGATTGLYASLAQTPLIWVVVFAPIGFALFFGMRLQAMSYSTAQITFWLFSAVMGLSLSYIFLRYTGASIARTFFITAGTFAGMSLYGYTTKTDLSRFGSFLIMGLWGVVLASIVNMFLLSPGIQFAISVIGVLVFVGLTAWDTQRIKEMYFELDDSEMSGKKAILGALNLYLDFINLFILLLQFVGTRRD
jgi:FtsH-binding integral membrane protein